MSFPRTELMWLLVFACTSSRRWKALLSLWEKQEKVFFDYWHSFFDSWWSGVESFMGKERKKSRKTSREHDLRESRTGERGTKNKDWISLKTHERRQGGQKFGDGAWHNTTQNVEGRVLFAISKLWSKALWGPLCRCGWDVNAKRKAMAQKENLPS